MEEEILVKITNKDEYIDFLKRLTKEAKILKILLSKEPLNISGRDEK